MPWLAPLNPPIRDWHPRRVWLIGGSAGIGAALAEALAARGATLALSARDEQTLKACAARCADRSQSGAEPLALPLDLTQPESIVAARDRLLSAWGGLDVVVLCAGTYTPMRAWELTAERVQQTLRTNLEGILIAVASIVPDLLRQGRGALVLVGSVAGYGGLPQATAYGPSKAALINLAETLYLDLAPHGIGVHLISPGFVATRLTAGNRFPMPALMQPPEAAAAILDGLACGRFETHFPKRFSLPLRLLRWLPRRAYFALIRRTTGAGR